MEEAVEDGINPHIRANHIKKRALKNKSLSVSFNEKDLKYVPHSLYILSLSNSWFFIFNVDIFMSFYVQLLVFNILKWNYYVKFASWLLFVSWFICLGWFYVVIMWLVFIRERRRGEKKGSFNSRKLRGESVLRNESRFLFNLFFFRHYCDFRNLCVLILLSCFLHITNLKKFLLAS